MDKDLIPWEKVEQFAFAPGDAPVVAELFYHANTGKRHYDIMHSVGGDGVLVCKCDVQPTRTEYHYLADFEPQHRWVVCPQSQEYLRGYTAHLMKRRK